MGSLFQNFYNRHTAYYIFASRKSYYFSYLISLLLTPNSFLDVSYRNSSTVSNVCNHLQLMTNSCSSNIQFNII